MRPALGYRFDFEDRSIAFSGDTAASEAVMKMAKGADVLVHEAMYVPAMETYIRGEIAKGRPIKFEDLMANMKADHTPVEDVRRIAQEAGVKTLVLSHLIPAFDGIDDDTWRAAAAKYFRGEMRLSSERNLWLCEIVLSRHVPVRSLRLKSISGFGRNVQRSMRAMPPATTA